MPSCGVQVSMSTSVKHCTPKVHGNCKGVYGRIVRIRSCGSCWKLCLLVSSEATPKKSHQSSAAAQTWAEQGQQYSQSGQEKD